MTTQERVKLGEISEIICGGTPKTSVAAYWSDDIKWVTAKDISESSGYKIHDSERKISKEGLENSAAKIIPSLSTALIARGATMGRSCMLAEDMAINQTCYAFIPNENSVDPYYLFYSIKNLYAFFQNVAHGAIFNTVIGSGLKETEIFFPPLPEQKAIAAVLSSLDDKIDLLQRQNATLEAMAQTLFRQWFVEEADDNWEEVPLQNITDIAIGRTPPRKEFHWFSTNPGDNKWMSIKDLGSSGVFIADTSEYLTQDAIERFNIPIIPDKTVVLSFKMTVGRVAITDGEMTSNEAIAHFRLQDDTPFCKEYLYFFLKLFPYEVLGSTSSIVTSINTKMIKAMEIPIPDSDLMDRFSEQVETFFDNIRTNQMQIRTLEKLRDTLLPKLMSGEVRVQL